MTLPLAGFFFSLKMSDLYTHPLCEIPRWSKWGCHDDHCAKYTKWDHLCPRWNYRYWCLVAHTLFYLIMPFRIVIKIFLLCSFCTTHSWRGWSLIELYQSSRAFFTWIWLLDAHCLVHFCLPIKAWFLPNNVLSLVQMWCFWFEEGNEPLSHGVLFGSILFGTFCVLNS